MHVLIKIDAAYNIKPSKTVTATNTSLTTEQI